jgi:hypothetical protein
MTTKSHPLETVVLQALEQNNPIDAASLGSFMAGDVERPVSIGYVLVARDVLARMESSGKLQCDIAGHYHIRRKVHRQNREAR